MKVHRHKSFKKQFNKLAPKLQRKTESVLLRLAQNPYDPRLHNHTLRGSFQGQRAISVTGDVRIIFEEFNDYQIVSLLRVGTHSQVY